MMARKTVTVGVVGAALWLFVLGFVLFAARVSRVPDQATIQADGIVVLTGGPARIAEAARLLKAKRGERLLISGINRQTSRETIMKLAQLPAAQFDCCVDLDYAALDTIGNAEQTRQWAAKHHYTRVIVVTSRVHMPRSLAEIGRAIPSVQLIPHAVVGSSPQQPWWLSPSAARVIVSEYVKFIPAAARLIVARTFGHWDADNVAGGQNGPLAKTTRL